MHVAPLMIIEIGVRRHEGERREGSTFLTMIIPALADGGPLRERLSGVKLVRDRRGLELAVGHLLSILV